jgi:hypothetical protein
MYCVSHYLTEGHCMDKKVNGIGPEGGPQGLQEWDELFFEEEDNGLGPSAGDPAIGQQVERVVKQFVRPNKLTAGGDHTVEAPKLQGIEHELMPSTGVGTPPQHEDDPEHADQPENGAPAV